MEATTEQRILEAARQIFTAKGFAGARMQDIADEAKINKAMLHYYFRSKKKLFEIIFKEQLTRLLAAFRSILSTDDSFKKKLKDIITEEFSMLHQYPELPLFILHEANNDPQLIERTIGRAPTKELIVSFESSIKKSVEIGEIRPVDATHLLVNIMSLCIYPFVARPIIKTVLGLDDPSYQQFLEHRPALLHGVIWKSLSTDQTI